MTTARPQRGGIVCGVDGSAHARLAAKAALSLADRLGMRLTLVHVAPVRTLLPVASFPADVDPSAYPRSVEVAEVQAAESFGSLSSELNRPDVARAVRLGEPATVLAELAAETRRSSSSSGLADAVCGAQRRWDRCPPSWSGSPTAR
jgi:nucleotide-binding universal stress UspA family protein